MMHSARTEMREKSDGGSGLSMSPGRWALVQWRRDSSLEARWLIEAPVEDAAVTSYNFSQPGEPQRKG